MEDNDWEDAKRHAANGEREPLDLANSSETSGVVFHTMMAHATCQFWAGIGRKKNKKV